MELKDLIERAEKAAGSQKALGLIIGQAPSHIRNAKAGMQGLPTYACVQIAELIEVPAMTVIAASELITEKKTERRAIFLPFVGRAASVLIGALVIFNMSPTPANAAPVTNSFTKNVYYVKSRKYRRQLKQRFLKILQMSIPKSFRRFLIPRIHHMPA